MPILCKGELAAMAQNRVLTQDEIDHVFKKMAQGSGKAKAPVAASTYDFRQPDRIPKDQLREIHLLHENFCRNLASSLSAYLRAYVMVNLVSVLQLSYSEFIQCFPSPTCLAVLSLRPFEGKGILEFNPSLAFPIIEILLGGHGNKDLNLRREITEIEQAVLDGALRIILRDLREAWTSVANFDLKMEALETEPQLVQTLSPNEPVVAVGVEVKLGSNTGMLNFGVPAIIVKMLRQKFDQRWSVRKSEATEEEVARMAGLATASRMKVSAQLQGPTISVRNILKMQVGDVIAFDYPATRPIQVLLNGKPKFEAHLATSGNKKAVRLRSASQRPEINTVTKALPGETAPHGAMVAQQNGDTQ
ncbi:MAG: flagellar motor switch protein FliM [Bryobacterales bacterium]|nr:flagellar motor switch protein FliM [Bryobacterales bacterium]